MKKRILVRQKDFTDCGAACLASVAAYYRLQLPISRIRQYAGTDKLGTNISGMIAAAGRLHFQAKGVRGAADSLSKIPLPAIAHIILANGLNHYVVIYRVKLNHILIMDPATGNLCKEKKEIFIKKWGGVLLLLLPDDDFKQGNQKISTVKLFWQLINPYRNLMIQALTGAIIYTVLGLSTSFYVQKIIDLVLVDGNARLLNLMSVIMIVLLIFQLCFGYFKSLTGLQTGQYIDARLILGYYKHLLKLPKFFFDTMQVGEIISRVNDAVKIRVFINDIALSIVVNILIIFFSIAIMFLYYWKLALIICLIIPVYVFIFKVSNSINKKWQRVIMEKAASLETQMLETIHTSTTIKSFRLEEFTSQKTEHKFIELSNVIYTCNKRNLFIVNTCEFITHLFTIIILWAGSNFVIDHQLSPGELLSFYALIGYFTNPLFSLVNVNKNMHDALIAADRLFEIIDLETEPVHEKEIMLTAGPVGDIQFNHVKFRYGQRQVVFDDLNMRIKKNSITAIVGENGSGKSTVFSLLQNFYPLTGGDIMIGDINIKYINKKSLRKIISIVPQKIDLFAGTIIDNIAVGEYKPDLKKILFLCSLLGINEFIEKLPDNYYATLGEQGNNLSGGQRQRLAIARALYQNPEILLLDEATSSLDQTSDQKVQEALAWFKNQDKTIIIIAHKLSAIKSCDDIIVLKDGRVIEQGSHELLMNKNNCYAKLFD